MLSFIENCFNSDLHKIGKTLSHELRVINYLKLVLNKDTHGLSRAFGVLIGELAATCEQLADG